LDARPVIQAAPAGLDVGKESFRFPIAQGAPADRQLRQQGVRTIINLRMTNDVWSAEEEKARDVGIAYTNVPMSGIGRPTDEQVAKVLSIIETGTNPVFVHCQHGADRTGTIIACYRIRHDKWPSKQALQEAKEYGMSPLEIGMKRYVAEFEKSHKPDFFLGRPMK